MSEPNTYLVRHMAGAFIAFSDFLDVLQSLEAFIDMI